MQKLPETDMIEVVRSLGTAAHAFAGKTVLMTGARGFLGRHFTQVFTYLNENVLEKPCSFAGFDNFVASRADEADDAHDPHVRFEKRDVIQPLSWDGRLDYVIHAAGIASP